MWIIDMGSGNSCKNDKHIVDAMLGALFPIPRHKVVLKWQLFQASKVNTPLDREVFEYAYWSASNYGFKTTASVADLDSLKFLKQFQVPWVKIPCRPDLYSLIMDNTISWIVSVPDNDILSRAKFIVGVTPLVCVREYPAKDKDYMKFHLSDIRLGVSDHTVEWRLHDTIKPIIYECHLKLHDTTGPDAGPWARYPEDIVKRIAMEV